MVVSPVLARKRHTFDTSHLPHDILRVQHFQRHVATVDKMMGTSAIPATIWKVVIKDSVYNYAVQAQ